MEGGSYSYLWEKAYCVDFCNEWDVKSRKYFLQHLLCLALFSTYFFFSHTVVRIYPIGSHPSWGILLLLCNTFRCLKCAFSSYSDSHFFIQQMFVEYSVCIRYCSLFWWFDSEQGRHNIFFSFWSHEGKYQWIRG